MEQAVLCLLEGLALSIYHEGEGLLNDIKASRREDVDGTVINKFFSRKAAGRSYLVPTRVLHALYHWQIMAGKRRDSDMALRCKLEVER